MSKINLILGLKNTIKINFKAFPFREALKFPIYCSHRVKIKGIHKGSIQINGLIKRHMIDIGLQTGSEGLMAEKSVSYIGTDENSKIIFNGSAIINSGTALKAINGGVLTVGKNLYCNSFCKILCKKEITIGDDNLFGWNITINDGDGHVLKNSCDPEKKKINPEKSINIGNRVWLCAHTSLLKGCKIPDDSVVAYNSVVLEKFEQSNTIIGGYPAKVIKTNINWAK